MRITLPVSEISNSMSGVELGPGQGRWVRAGSSEFRLTCYTVLWKDGIIGGFKRQGSTITLSNNGAAFTVHGGMDLLDADQNLVFSTTFDGNGTRLESLRDGDTRMIGEQNG
jgi:hypothetical protein